MIIGTAGHIDHGKSTLVKALTGIDTDRLPEERQRGMSIELGYAFMPMAGAPSGEATRAQPGSRAGQGQIGFIDVPGHEKLVHTMIAGATGIDFALLLVAADDGVMPQTREHLAVLSLLGIGRGAVALTKIDRVDAARQQAVRDEIEALLAGTSLEGAPVLAVSATTGEGVDALRSCLQAQAQAQAQVQVQVPAPAPAKAGAGEGEREDTDAAAVARSPDPATADADDKVDTIGAIGTARTDDAAPAVGAAGPGGRSGDRAHPGGPLQADAATAAATGAEIEPARGFRLAIDRVFSLDGVGTVATGTVHAGSVTVGEALQELPDGAGGLRVRSLHAQNRATERAVQGQRCAVGLAGIERDALERGQWLTQPGLGEASDRLDVVLRLWPGESRALRSGTRVHLHLGTATSTASVAVLEGDSLAPGAQGLVQLVLPRPLPAWHGDRLILRDAAGQRILAGGRVMDVRAPARYRRTPQRLQLLTALQQPGWHDRLAGLLAVSPAGFSLRQWQQSFGLASPDSLLAMLTADEGLAHRRLGEDVVIGEAAWQALRQTVLAALADYHQSAPAEIGPDAARLRRLVRSRMDDTSWRQVLALLAADKAVVISGAFVHLPDHGTELAARDEALLQRLLPLVQAAGAQGAWVRDLAEAIGQTPAELRVAMARLARSGRLHQVVRDLYLDELRVKELAALVRRLGAEGSEDPARPLLTVAAFRDASGLGRKRAVQVLEFFDRIGLCRRVGDQHVVRLDSRVFLDEPA